MPEDIPRLTASERHIIEALVAGKNEQYGLQLVEGSGGLLSRNSIYVVLDRLESKGFVESTPEPKDPKRPGIPRRMYKVTGKGAYALKLVRDWESFVLGGTAHA